MDKQFEMKAKVKDEITEFTGRVTGHAEYLGGYDSYRVEALVDGEAKEEWFDVSRLTEVG